MDAYALVLHQSMKERMLQMIEAELHDEQMDPEKQREDVIQMLERMKAKVKNM